MMITNIIIVEQSEEDFDGYDTYSKANIRMFNSLNDLFNEPDFRDELKRAGFVNEGENKALRSSSIKEDRFYIYQDPKEPYLNVRIREIKDKNDLKLNTSEIEAFAKNRGSVLQAISSESVLDEKTFDLIRKAKKAAKAREAAAKQAVETKKANARAKEIEKARKVLEAAGELKSGELR